MSDVQDDSDKRRSKAIRTALIYIAVISIGLGVIFFIVYLVRKNNNKKKPSSSSNTSVDAKPLEPEQPVKEIPPVETQPEVTTPLPLPPANLPEEPSTNNEPVLVEDSNGFALKGSARVVNIYRPDTIVHYNAQYEIKPSASNDGSTLSIRMPEQRINITSDVLPTSLKFVVLGIPQIYVDAIKASNTSLITLNTGLSDKFFVDIGSVLNVELKDSDNSFLSIEMFPIIKTTGTFVIEGGYAVFNIPVALKSK